MARLALLFAALGWLATTGVFAAEKSEDLPERYRLWLESVDLLIEEGERAHFVTLEEDFRREAFISAFWAARDPDPKTHANELRIVWEDRAAEALVQFDSLLDARSELYLMHGEPYDRCWHRSRKVEVWTLFEGNPESFLQDQEDFVAYLLYEAVADQPWERLVPPLPGSFRLRSHPSEVPIQDHCTEAELSLATLQALAMPNREPRTVNTLLPPEPSKEWVPSFAARTTDLPDASETFPADVTLRYPGRHQQRTVLQALVAIEPAVVSASGEEGGAAYQFDLIGEVVRRGSLLDSFRYRFEIPANSEEPTVALLVQRYLRPGSARLLLRIEDLFGRRFARYDQVIEIPSVEELFRPEAKGGLEESELFRQLAELEEATARGERTLRLLEPQTVVVTGLHRFQAFTAGEFARVEFVLDETPVLSKRRPPFSVELDFGPLPALHRLRVDGFDEEGRIVATDEILLNPGGQRFRVHLTEPRSDRRYEKSLRAAVQVIPPEGDTVERVELFLAEKRIATLYQPPWVQPVLLPDAGLVYVRAVAYLEDGSSAEDLVFINAPGELEEVQVNFVELYATVVDRQGRPISGLPVESFQVLEDGEPQRASRFEWVENLPLHVLLLIDTSASMAESLDRVATAATGFVEEVIEPRDRASVISFSGQPRVGVGFTNEVETLARNLQSLRAEGGTALYDSLVFALHSFHGMSGQKALILLSDGQDESSAFELDEAREFARRAGVTLYAIGLHDAEWTRPGRRVLRRLAEDTGGRAFFVRTLEELPGIYAEIQSELRSQYLFAYQSTSDKDPSEFRSLEVRVEVDGKEMEVRSMGGYYP